MISNLKDGELVIKEQAPINTDLKQVVPEEITNFGGAQFKSMGIDVNVVMEVLQNKMYSNKSICFQELPCNGLDAIKRRINSGYRDFSPEIKIIISDKDGSITINDNGCGMSEKVIDQVYRFYGRSDKRNTMDEIGMFGMGSKSPFAIVDEFIIETEAIEDQMRCKYLVTKRGIIQLSRSPSTGNFGTTIIFARPTSISTYEIETFLQTKFKYWNLPVNVYNVSPSGETRKTRSVSKEKCTCEDVFRNEYPSATIRWETDDYIFLSGPNIEDQKIFVGQIPYDFYETSQKLDEIFRGKFAIFLKNPNAISLSATRENIEKDEKMKMLIKDIEEKAQEHIEKEIHRILGSFKVEESTKYEDIEWIYGMNSQRNTIERLYPNIYSLFRTNCEYYDNGVRDSRTLISNFKVAKERKKQIVWTIRKSVDLRSVPEDNYVLVLNTRCGVCSETVECLQCSKRNSEGRCDYDKKHWIMSKFPEFVPIKIKKKVNPQNFRAFSLKKNRYCTFDIGSIPEDCMFTVEDFKPMQNDAFKISKKRLEEILKVKPNLNVVTKEQYNKKMMKTLRFYNTKDNSMNLEELEKCKTIIYGVSTYGKDSIIQKMFSHPEDSFLRDLLSEEIMKHLESKGIETMNMETYLKKRKVRPKLRLKNLSLSTALEIIEKLENHKDIKYIKNGNVITFEENRKK